MTTSTPDTTTTDDEYTERRFWRDLLDKIMAALGRGEEVDAEELADVRSKAEAETEVETARKTAHERKRERREQDAAAKRADELVAQMDADVRGTVEAEINAAWEAYLDATEAAAATLAEHAAQVDELAREVRKAGVPTVDGITQSNRTTRITGDRIVSAPGGQPVPTWGGVTYGRPSVEADKLPHRADQSERRRRIEQMRGTVY
ncbi:hypothetical protein G6024_00015 [Dietzia maris]|nr:hypothetical protein [Dietzia maris]MBB0995512.1 hypothetical protein [Dietzia maris]